MPRVHFALEGKLGIRSYNPLTTFTFNTSRIRVVTHEGNPWFVAKDVCDVLDMTASRGTNMYLRHLDSEEKQPISPNLIVTRGSPLTVISESGLYKLIMRSDKPQAKAFQDWVTKEVLPSIRKDGAYIMGEEKMASGEMSEDEFVLKAISILQKKVDRLAQSQSQQHPPSKESPDSIERPYRRKQGRGKVGQPGRPLTVCGGIYGLPASSAPGSV